MFEYFALLQYSSLLIGWDNVAVQKNMNAGVGKVEKNKKRLVYLHSSFAIYIHHQTK